MKNKFVIFAVLAAMTFFWIPAESNYVSAQNRQTRTRQNDNSRNYPSRVYRRSQTRDWNRGKKKNVHGYRNYGQYRRTQVGNRRFRLVQQPYYRDGRRLTRMVRVYY